MRPLSYGLSYGDCVACIDMMFKKARKDKRLPLAASITDAHGDLIAFGRMDGAPVRTVTLSRNKAYTSIFMDRDTPVFRDMMTQYGFELNWFGNPQLTALPGGARIIGASGCVGAIGLSGRSADQDHEYALLGVEFLKKRLAG